MRRLSQTKLRLIACAWYFGTLAACLSFLFKVSN